LRLELKKVKEFSDLLKFDDPFPTESFRSIDSVLLKLQVEGNWLSKEELFRLLNWLLGISKTREYLKKRKEKYPELDKMVNSLSFQSNLIPQIAKILDERGNIRDTASAELAKIRREIISSSKNLRTSLYKILRRAYDSNWSLDKEITIRNDRLVIPLRAEAKGRIAGFVQDVSQSGGTVYVEPSESLALNNKLRELKIGEQNEIIRILRKISLQISSQITELAAFSGIIVHLELISAKALLAKELAATLPYIEKEGEEINVTEAYYPLLQLKSKQENIHVIPLAFKLNKKERIMVISGPNAGGKSVALKTIGLLQLMLQSGFLIPVNEGSVFRLFDSLFVDIGDEQSIENDLSTYTSHLYQMRQMGDNMNHKSLFLIDEFGSGTDPKQGGAIAEAFLERFVRQRAYGIITTHYGNLKDYAEVQRGVVNAAMQFDTEGLQPTYHIISGIPGRSYAFEMAKRVGVHYSILKKARQKVGTDEIDTDKLLKKLEEKNTELARLISENKSKASKLEKLVEKNEQQKQEMRLKRKVLMRDAQLEAKNLIEKANKRIESTIREIREKQAEKEVTKKLREKLKASKPNPAPLPQQAPKTSENNEIKILAGEPIVVGDWVKWKDSANTGKLLEIQGKRAIVELGEIKLTVKLKQLVKIQMPSLKKKKTNVLGGIPFAQARLELNVMGKRVEEALPEVDKFLDAAMLSGLKWVKILHGKGTGVLRDAIRKHLRNFSFVEAIHDAPLDQGGSGWTVVDMK